MNADDALFKDRTPEAAARQLAVVLAYATERQLATLERVESRKYSAARDIKRHREIAATLVRHCHELGVGNTGLDGRRCLRLELRLAALSATVWDGHRNVVTY